MRYESVEMLCPRCDSAELFFDPETGENVCCNCGLVVSEKNVSRAPEWRAFTMEDRARKMRTGMPMTYTQYDKGLFTSFRTDKDSSGKRLRSDEKMKMNRLKRHDHRSKMKESQFWNLSRAMTILDMMASKLHLKGSVREKAAVTYRKALKKDLIKGRTIEGFVAASIYATCRHMMVPRSLKEVAEASTLDLKNVSRIYRLLIKELDLRMPIDYPMKFVPRIASELDISRETDRLAVQILKKAKEQKILTGKDPRGIAAAALYLACKVQNEKCTQKEISFAAETTEVTLRNRLKDLQVLVYGRGQLEKTPDPTYMQGEI